MNLYVLSLLLMLASVGMFLISAAVVCSEQVPDSMRWLWRRITGRTPGSQ